MRRAYLLIGVVTLFPMQASAQPVPTTPDSSLPSAASPSNISPALQIGTLEFKPDDYPKEALRSNMSGFVMLRFRIGTDGAVEDCNAWGEYPVLNAVSCALAKERWHFVPEKKDGTPIPSLKDQRVHWVIPETPPLVFPLASGTIQIVHFTLNPDASKQDCSVDFTPASPSAVGASEEISERADQVCANLPHFDAVRDLAGKPVTKRVTITSYAKIEDVPADLKK